MNNLRRIKVLVVFLLLALVSILPVTAQDTGKARFVHVVPGVGAVDVYINQQLAVQSLAFGTGSLYLNLPTGDHTVDVTAAGDTTAVWTQTITVDAERPQTFIASEPTQFLAVPENLGEAPLGNTRLLLVHAIAGAPAVDIKLSQPVTLGGVEQAIGTPIATAMAYNTTFGAFDIPTNTYIVDVTVSGEDTVLLNDVALSLASGTSYIAVVYGTADAPQALLLQVATQAGTDTGLVRFIHASPNAGAVDLYVDDTLIVTSLAPETATEHIALPAGEYTVAVTGVGDRTLELATTTLTVETGSAQTASVIDTPGAAVLAITADDVSGALDSTNAVISVINGLAGAVIDTVSVDTDTIAEAVAFSEASAAASLPATDGAINLSLTLNDEAGEVNAGNTLFYAGTYYNLIVVDGGTFGTPKVLVFPTALSTTLGSAPNGQTMLASDVVVAATPVAVATAGAPVEVVPAATLPPVTIVEDVITGRVLLDPGANLQLRQNPSPDALSLGLAPSATVLIVNGREGAPVALVDGQEAPAEAANFVDPVGLLPDETTDLDPATTWVRVTYNTPDGGQITAWVLAQFLDIRDGRNAEVLLRDLEPIGGNIPGTAEATLVTPPPIPTDTLTAVVYNLDPGVSLNIRRLPTVDAEVIGKVTNGTTVVFIGNSEDDQWAYIEYTTAEGGIIDGWVTTLYIQYQYNGKTYDVDAFKDVVSRTTSQALFEIIPTDTIGGTRGNVGAIAVPTVDPLKDQFVATVSLNSGTNLQLRRNPDPTSESLNLVPSGTQLIVSARTDLSDWFKVTFEGEEGWVASDFVVVTFNNAPVTLADIPIEVAQP